MSTGIISVTTFFKDNGLFKLLELKDGAMNKSYKTKSQEYVMECEKCGQQVEQRGNAVFQCRRCRRSVVPDRNDDDELIWVIEEPTGKLLKKAEEAMLKPAKVFPKFAAAAAVEEVEEEAEEEREEPKPPSAATMVDFLKGSAPKVSGKRVAARKKARDEEEARDIDEPSDDVILPTKKASVPKPKETPVVEPVAETIGKCPKAKEVTMKVVELSPGQTFYCKESGILFICKPQ